MRYVLLVGRKTSRCSGILFVRSRFRIGNKDKGLVMDELFVNKDTK